MLRQTHLNSLSLSSRGLDSAFLDNGLISMHESHLSRCWRTWDVNARRLGSQFIMRIPSGNLIVLILERQILWWVVREELWASEIIRCICEWGSKGVDPMDTLLNLSLNQLINIYKFSTWSSSSCTRFSQINRTIPSSKMTCKIQ